jgi:lycopene beta-cyclase
VSRPDLVLLGGGLASGLIAAALHGSRPDLSFLILERGDRLGGNHTWSFHETDLSAREAGLVAPFVAHRWPAHEVIFPRTGRRRIGSGYASVPSDRFAAVLEERLAGRVRTGAEAVEVTPTAVTLRSGERIEAGAVIDARGPAPTSHLSLGFQKFCGLEVRLRRPVAVEAPILMDATVPQQGGFRFVYTLPFAPDRLLVEATAYSDAPDLADETYAADALAYAAAQGWEVERVEREERGVLPITLAGDPGAFWEEARGAPRAGLRAGLFHPATGYSLPEAARLALLIAGMRDLSAPALFAAIRDHALKRWRDQGFYRAVNRMLFLAAEPEARVRVFEHFYRLPEPLVGRFYAGRSTVADKARILTGRPPVPVPSAFGALARRHPIGTPA